MSSLSTIEKRYIEDLLGMGSGYVLDFSDASFAEYFRTNLGIDIHSSKYAFNGPSKAKKFRAFWEIETDEIVGKALSGMLDLVKYENKRSGKSEPDDVYDECRKIANNLLGKPQETEHTEEQFLSKDYGDISLDSIVIDAALLPVMNARLIEAKQCLHVKSPLASIFMCGSLLEGLLLGLASNNPKQFNQAKSSAKDKAGKVKLIHDWSLSQLIDVACELGYLKLDVKKFSHALRDFRNYIHPYEQMTSGFNPDMLTAEICLQVLKAAIADLSGDR